MRATSRKALRVPKCLHTLLLYTQLEESSQMLLAAQTASCPTSARSHSTTIALVTDIIRGAAVFVGGNQSNLSILPTQE